MKKRHILTKVEYLILFANAIEDIISIATEELHYSSIKECNDTNINKNNEVNSYIKFSLTAI